MATTVTYPRPGTAVVLGAHLLAVVAAIVSAAVATDVAEMAAADSLSGPDTGAAVVYFTRRVFVVFAGAPPLFTKSPAWDTRALARFESLLGAAASKAYTVTERDMYSDADSVSDSGHFHATAFQSVTGDGRNELRQRDKPTTRTRGPSSRSPLAVRFDIDIAFASEPLTKVLGEALSLALHRNPATTTHGTVRAVDGAAIADEYFRHLSLHNHALSPPGTFVLLVFNPIDQPTGSAYGYAAGPVVDEIGVTGLSVAREFAFLDTAARPNALATGRNPDAGEILASVSFSEQEYARELGRILQALLVPPPSKTMRPFPEENRISFKLFYIDTEQLVASSQASQVSSLLRTPPGLTARGQNFSVQQFTRLLSSLTRSAFREDFNVVTEIVDPVGRLDVALAFCRAFQAKGKDWTIDPDAFLRDLRRIGEVSGNTAGINDVRYATDLSFVPHVPIFLFSFADAAAVIHLNDGKQVRCRPIGNEAVVVVENRKPEPAHNTEDVTSLAAKAALELVLGLRSTTLELVDVSQSALPPLLIKIAKQNILHQRLAWSKLNAVDLARRMIDFDGYDAEYIAHGSETLLGVSLNVTRKLLEATYVSWRKASVSLDASEIVNVSFRLRKSALELRERLYDDVCSQSLKDEFRLESGVNGMNTNRMKGNPEANGRRRLLAFPVVPVIAGVITGIVLRQFELWCNRLSTQRRSVVRRDSTSWALWSTMEVGMPWALQRKPKLN